MQRSARGTGHAPARCSILRIAAGTISQNRKISILNPSSFRRLNNRRGGVPVATGLRGDDDMATWECGNELWKGSQAAVELAEGNVSLS